MLRYHLFVGFYQKYDKNNCVGNVVGNAGHLLVFAQCVRDTGQNVEMRDCPAECGTVPLNAGRLATMKK